MAPLWSRLVRKNADWTQNVITSRRNVLQIPGLRQSRDLLVVTLRLDIRAYCFNSS